MAISIDDWYVDWVSHLKNFKFYYKRSQKLTSKKI